MKNHMERRFFAVAAALAADRLLGELPNPVHPVALYGKAMTRLETFLWRDTIPAGGIYNGVGLGLVALVYPFVGPSSLATFCAAYLCIAEKSLLGHALRIEHLLGEGDLDAARELLPALVGRDRANLSSEEIARAVVESVAENSSDAVIAPMFYGALFGAGGVLAYRAINTMDSMVGYKSKQYLHFGRISAKIDDVANFIPARLAGLLAWAVPANRKVSFMAAVSDAGSHPSPNAGVVESVYAHKLGVVLGGENSYDGKKETRNVMGTGRRPSRCDISGASRLCRKADSLFALALVALGLGIARVEGLWR